MRTLSQQELLTLREMVRQELLPLETAVSELRVGMQQQLVGMQQQLASGIAELRADLELLHVRQGEFGEQLRDLRGVLSTPIRADDGSIGTATVANPRTPS